MEEAVVIRHSVLFVVVSPVYSIFGAGVTATQHSWRLFCQHHLVDLGMVRGPDARGKDKKSSVAYIIVSLFLQLLKELKRGMCIFIFSKHDFGAPHATSSVLPDCSWLSKPVLKRKCCARTRLMPNFTPFASANVNKMQFAT